MAALPDAIAQAADGRPFVVDFAGPLPEHAQRLMEVLGVTVRIRRSSSETALPLSMAATYSRDIDAGPARRINGVTCAKCESADRCRRERYCQRAQQAHRLLQRREKEKEAGMGSGLDALERMDKGEPQQAPPATNGKAEWTRDRAIAAIQEFHREHGRSPKQHELRLPLPSASWIYKEFGGHGAAMKAAGLEPVGRGRRPAAVKPPPVEKPAEPEPAVPEPAASVSSPSSEEAKPEAPISATVTLADKARHLVHLTEQLEQARDQVTDLEAQVRQIATEIAA